MFKNSSSPVKASDLIRSTRPTCVVSPTKSDQNKTNLRCTADHHAVPPLNIRPVESGIIPDHFSTGWKTYPAHHNLSSYIQTRRPTNPRSFPTNFYSLVGYDRVKNYPLWLKSVSIPDQPPLYPRCTPDAPTLKSRCSRPTPVLPADQSPLCTTNPQPIPDATTLTTLNIGPTRDLISIPGLKWIIQANRMPTDSSTQMYIWPIL